MSFDPAFDARWSTVLQPALKSVLHNGIPLDPFRVDLSRSGDAILTEVLQAIADSFVIIADITARHELDRRPVRNGNVMYEVGLAHAARLPEEVLLFRSDSFALDFDIAGVRVHSYDPESDPVAARRLVAETVVDAQKGLAARRRTAVRAAGRRLTLPATNMLFEALMKGNVSHPATGTIVQALSAVERTQAITLLLELGAIQASPLRMTPEVLAGLTVANAAEPSMLTYKPTAFAKALIEYLGEAMGCTDPALRSSFEALLGKEKPDGAA